MEQILVQLKNMKKVQKKRKAIILKAFRVLGLGAFLVLALPTGDLVASLGPILVVECLPLHVDHMGTQCGHLDQEALLRVSWDPEDRREDHFQAPGVLLAQVLVPILGTLLHQQLDLGNGAHRRAGISHRWEP
jgi:hypothetical protein